MAPQDFIDHAKFLLKSEKGKPKQIALRRSISAAYYALFHAFLGAAADDLVGASNRARKSTAYKLVYRAFEHSNMRNLCFDAAKPTLPRKLADQIGGEHFPEAIQVPARAFVELQGRRHLADYDPHFRFTKSDASVAIEMASFANDTFETANKSDKRNFLLCMLFPVR